MRHLQTIITKLYPRLLIDLLEIYVTTSTKRPMGALS